MNEVKKQQLTGFRESSMEEREMIFKYMNNQFNKENKILRVWNIIFGIIYICCILNAIMKVVSFITGTGENIMSPQSLLFIVFIFIFTLIIISQVRGKKNSKEVLEKINRGEFQVLDCMAYKVDFCTDLVNKAVIYICNEQGQHCTDGLVIDYISAKEWSETKSVNFLLMKVKLEKSEVYELFSENKLKLK